MRLQSLGTALDSHGSSEFDSLVYQATIVKRSPKVTGLTSCSTLGWNAIRRTGETSIGKGHFSQSVPCKRPLKAELPPSYAPSAGPGAAAFRKITIETRRCRIPRGAPGVASWCVL